jgi:hypothetical protein
MSTNIKLDKKSSTVVMSSLASASGSSNSTSATMIDVNKAKKSSRIKLISLSTLVFTCLIFMLQAYLVYERYSLLKELNTLLLSESFSFFYVVSPSSTTGIDKKFQNTIITNAIIVTFALMFAIFSFATGSLRLGIYMHDNFFVGKTLDKSIKKMSKENKKNQSPYFIAMIANNSSTSSSSASSSTEDSKEKLTKPNGSIIAKLNCCSTSKNKNSKNSKKSKRWSQLPPIAACFHLISSIFLLIAECQLNSKQIQLGQKPVSN